MPKAYNGCLITPVFERGASLDTGNYRLSAIKSIYEDSELSMIISGRVGPAVSSQAGVKQGCPLSPMLFGLYADGLHQYLKLYCPGEGFMLSDGTWLQIWATQTISCCWQVPCLMAMVISNPKTFVLVFNLAFPGPYQWTISGAALQIVSQVKYLGLLFHVRQPPPLALWTSSRRCMGPGLYYSDNMNGCSACHQWACCFEFTWSVCLPRCLMVVRYLPMNSK